MHHKFPLYYAPVIPIVSLYVLCSVAPAMSETVDGFRDLKFGMTEDEVKNLEVCSSSSECLYNLSGKNRYLSLEYQGSSKPSDNHSSSQINEASLTLARITIDMGSYSEEWYGELQMMLAAQYKMTHNLNEETIKAFNSEQTSTLILGYENEAILLKVVRRKFGNLVLKVVYQDETLATETRKVLPSDDL